MQIVHADELPESVGSSHRGGKSTYFRMFDGPEGSPGNFSVVIATSPGRYSPRHRHNFEQFRYQLEGDANYGRTGVLKPGMIGYFPEAVHYGPQTQEEGEMLSVLAIQFGGSSGSGYLGRTAQAEMTEELKKFGEFKNGAFRRRDVIKGKRNQDAFEAIWEYVNQRPLVYPTPRYEVPVLMDPAAYSWVPLSDQTGVSIKRLGTFTEAEASAACIRIEAGATFVGKGPRVIFVCLAGKGNVGGEPYRRLTGVYLAGAETATFQAPETSEFLQITLPKLEVLEHAAAEQEGAKHAAE